MLLILSEYLLNLYTLPANMPCHCLFASPSILFLSFFLSFFLSLPWDSFSQFQLWSSLPCLFFTLRFLSSLCISSMFAFITQNQLSSRPNMIHCNSRFKKSLHAFSCRYILFLSLSHTNTYNTYTYKYVQTTSTNPGSRSHTPIILPFCWWLHATSLCS